MRMSRQSTTRNTWCALCIGLLALTFAGCTKPPCADLDTPECEQRSDCSVLRATIFDPKGSHHTFACVDKE